MDTEEGHGGEKEEEERGGSRRRQGCGPYMGAVLPSFGVAVGPTAV
jgi:hypothetical protein